jgi:hypothetical protein
MKGASSACAISVAPLWRPGFTIIGTLSAVPPAVSIAQAVKLGGH